MPIKKGSSKKVIQENISELTKSGESKGHIGNVPTPTPKKANQVAVAISYDSAGKSKPKPNTRKK